MRAMLLSGLLAVSLVGLAVLPRPLSAPLPDTVFLEEMTWVEVRDAIESGETTVLIPTGGVEQNGPHMVLGKHGYIVRHTAERIAKVMGDTLVAPLVSYVPEGPIEPPQGNMAFAGTISVPDEVFAAVLEYAARSLKAHGFTTIAFLGDSGDNQGPQAAVARRLSAAWAGEGVRVLHLGDYYAANGQRELLLAEGESAAAIGRHAGIRDTSELMAVHPEGVRWERLAPGGGRASEPTGVNGDPTRATAARGEVLLQLKVDAAVEQLRAARAAGS